VACFCLTSGRLAILQVHTPPRPACLAGEPRSADEDEWSQIWAQARKIYAGYEAYAPRITDRKIHIMILSAS
jgi:hypothetical protein